MKQKDIVLIVVIAVFSAIVSLIIGHFAFAAPKNRQQKVEVVDAISTEFPLPDTRYFNEQSIDPTQLIRISENINVAPFSGVGR